jgi:hypothetical protein
VNRRISKSLFLIAAMVGVACIDMSSPKGAASISLVQLGSPYVVVGDVMRDSNGAPAPLAVIAYDGSNHPVPGLGAQFFLADSTQAAHIDPTNIVVGDQIGIARIIGQIGSLQTPAVTIPVTYAPDHILKGTPSDTLSVSFLVAGDTLSSIGTLALSALVKSALDSAVQGFAVRYVIVSAPASMKSTSPAVYLTDKGGRLGSADTTDATGQSAPRLAVNAKFLADSALQVGLKQDSVIVDAFAKYKGLPLVNSPLRFIVHLKITPVF